MNEQLIRAAFYKMREASFQSHNGHWDMTGGAGSGCPECVRAGKLREEADSMFHSATVDEIDRLQMDEKGEGRGE